MLQACRRAPEQADPQTGGADRERHGRKHFRWFARIGPTPRLPIVFLHAHARDSNRKHPSPSICLPAIVNKPAILLSASVRDDWRLEPLDAAASTISAKSSMNVMHAVPR